MAEPFRARAMLRVLVEHGVDFVVIGGIAGIARGSAYMTEDRVVASELRVLSDEIRRVE